MTHRTDIDGLRAIAVLPVVLFHAGYSWLPGGFVGVDVFFVISGFLICSILVREMEDQRFLFRAFYARRARRILPALLVVLSTTLLGGYFFLLPDEFIQLSEATLATLAFGPNIYFEQTASTYFGLDIATQPLMHTWSLGIEEQFYIFFPSLLLFIYKRFGLNSVKYALVAIFVGSLAANVMLTSDLTKFSFYMLPTRAWELLAGAILATGILPDVRGRALANLEAGVGLALIASTMLLLDEHAVFPGINAIPPVLGTAFVLHGNTHVKTGVASLLSRQPLVWVGLVSYSLYLWHWPVAVFTSMVADSSGSRMFVVAASIALAALSYRYVESRYRNHAEQLSSRRTWVELGSVGGLAALGAVFVISGQGLMQRIPADALRMANAQHDVSVPADCRTLTENRLGKSDEKGEVCFLGKKGEEPRFVVWGDSHATALSHAFHLAALREGVSGLSIVQGGCRPLAGVYRKNKNKCLHFNDTAMKLIEDTPSLEQVFLVGYWRVPLVGEGYDNSNYRIMDSETRVRSAAENRDVFERGLRRTFDQLTKRRVIVVEDIPEIGSQFGKSVSNHFARQVWLGARLDAVYAYQLMNDEFETEFAEVVEARPASVELLKVKPWLCENGACPLLIDGKLVYFDGDHLSAYGASLLVPALLPYFAADS